MSCSNSEKRERLEGGGVLIPMLEYEYCSKVYDEGTIPRMKPWDWDRSTSK